jgi:hypothetical protein
VVVEPVVWYAWFLGGLFLGASIGFFTAAIMAGGYNWKDDEIAALRNELYKERGGK